MTKTWGTATWYFFHTLAEKIKENEYDHIKDDILSYIKDICSVLPCPDCRDHAVKFMKRINIGHVNTKEELKHMLYIFHNSINTRKNLPQYSVDELELYKRGNFSKIFAYFKQEMGRALHNRQLNEAMARQMVLKNVTIFLQNNRDKFYP
tara:strand:- start:261 stop:710 length:450 start_codon:yes stop_codon:yes gene_type:complete